MRTAVGTTALVWTCLLWIPVSSVSAQTIVHSFADLTQTLTPGTSVRVIDPRGHKVDGVVAGLSASSLALTLADGRQQEFDERSVNEIDQIRHFALRGLALGGGAGVALGSWFYSVMHDCGECAPGPGWSVAVGTALGAAIGAGVGAKIVGGRTVYLSAPGGTRRSWTMAPVASARMRALAVSARF